MSIAIHKLTIVNDPKPELVNAEDWPPGSVSIDPITILATDQIPGHDLVFVASFDIISTQRVIVELIQGPRSMLTFDSRLLLRTGFGSASPVYIV